MAKYAERELTSDVTEPTSQVTEPARNMIELLEGYLAAQSANQRVRFPVNPIGAPDGDRLDTFKKSGVPFILRCLAWHH